MSGKKLLNLSLGLALTSFGWAGTGANRLFGDQEIQRIQQFWTQPGRYQANFPLNIQKIGVWQVRLTPEGSTWLRRYSQSRGLGKTPPNLTPVASGATTNWEAWINAKIAFDRANAALEARKKNVEQISVEAPKLVVAEDPGPAPENLVAQVGEPPLFAEAVAPKLHTITFDDGSKHSWTDNPDMRPRYEYYRFREGVMDGGTPMRQLPDSEFNALLRLAGIEGAVKKVFSAVSLLEGGFDSINTYDTGWVSVGFIQFACLTEGGGSLGRVLLRQKTDDPTSFERDFQRFGVNVTPTGLLSVLNLDTGEERTGNDAARQIITDKRLIAVFQRAGRLSTPNRVAQLKVAKDEYYPVSDSILVPVDGRALGGKVGQIIRSEAGLATLMDRKVNTGKLDPLLSVLQGIARKYKIERFDQFADVEREIVSAMRWRKNYLEDSSLSQPTQKPDTNSQGQPSFPPSTPR